MDILSADVRLCARISAHLISAITVAVIPSLFPELKAFEFSTYDFVYAVSFSVFHAAAMTCHRGGLARSQRIAQGRESTGVFVRARADLPGSAFLPSVDSLKVVSGIWARALIESLVSP